MPNDAEAVPDQAIVTAALAGLLAKPKTLPPSLFYDEEGCRLFYEITRAPEYYLTRTELALLATIAPEIVAIVPTGSALVEYGASDETKADFLLRQNNGMAFRAYVPIDVAAPALRSLRDRMTMSHPGLSVLPVVADFLRPVDIPASGHGTTGFFPGSTIGNLEPSAAISFLRRARAALGPKARFLLGFDTCQDQARLIPAYNDAAGITAAFNLNLLTRLNREAAATFNRGDFRHEAIWNKAESRIEMHLIARAAHTVSVAGQHVHFDRGESIHTENSYKYAPDRMAAMIAEGGWTRLRAWSDPDGLFALWLLG